MIATKTYKIVYKPFDYSDELMTFVGSVERFTFNVRKDLDGVLIKNDSGFHNLTLRNVVAYDEV